MWSKAGGGTLVENGDGTVTYTAPSTNPNCADNATITVSDCCGRSDSVQIAVNCYTPADIAFYGYGLRHVGPPDGVECLGPGGVFLGLSCIPYQYPYDCAGNYLGCIEDCYAGYTCRMSFPICEEPYDCGCINIAPKWCPGPGPGVYCDGEYRDWRTEAMKAAGCCPINPATGLPF